MPMYPQHKTLPTVTTLGHTDTAHSKFELRADERGNPVEGDMVALAWQTSVGAEHRTENEPICFPMLGQ